jgi:hypothetical protein
MRCGLVGGGKGGRAGLDEGWVCGGGGNGAGSGRLRNKSCGRGWQNENVHETYARQTQTEKVNGALETRKGVKKKETDGYGVRKRSDSCSS